MNGYDSDRLDLRIESRFKNALLYNALQERCKDAAKLLSGPMKPAGSILRTASQLSGICYQLISRFLCLTESPFSAHGGYKATAVALAESLGYTAEELFPVSLYALSLVVREISSPQVLSLQEAAAVHLLPSVDSVEASVDRRRAVADAWSALTPREEKILKRRFGFDGPEESLENIAADFSISRERLRQIEAGALRKLRNPKTSRGLRGLLR